MQHYRAVLLLTAVAAQAGCDCFRNEAAYRPLPVPAPARAATDVITRSAPDGDADFVTAAGMPGVGGPEVAGAAAVGAATLSALDRLDVADPMPAPRASWTGAEMFAPRRSAFSPRGSAYARLDASSSDPAPQQAAYRDPQRAFCFACLVAGGGHFYTGETTKGAALLGIAAAGLIGGAALSSSGSDDPFDCEYDVETHECEPDGGRTPLLVGAGIAAASWVYGIIDSRASAARANARNGVQVGAAALEMRPVLDLRRGGEGVGLSFRRLCIYSHTQRDQRLEKVTKQRPVARNRWADLGPAEQRIGIEPEQPDRKRWIR